MNGLTFCDNAVEGADVGDFPYEVAVNMVEMAVEVKEQLRYLEAN